MGHSLPLFCPWRGWARGLPNPKGNESACPAFPENSHLHNRQALALHTRPHTRALAPAPAPVLGTPRGPRGSRWVFCAPSTVPPFQRQEAGLLLVRGQVRAAAPGLRRQGRGRRAVLRRRGQLAAADQPPRKPGPCGRGLDARGDSGRGPEDGRRGPQPRARFSQTLHFRLKNQKHVKSAVPWPSQVNSFHPQEPIKAAVPNLRGTRVGAPMSISHLLVGGGAEAMTQAPGKGGCGSPPRPPLTCWAWF